MTFPGRRSTETERARVLPILLASHAPLDLVILMLGSNDLKPEVCGDAEGVADGIAALLDIIEESGAVSRTLVVSPPRFARSDLPGGQPRGGRSIAQSRRLGPLLRELAERRNAAYFDASAAACSSPIDGVHLDRENTRAIGTALIPVVRTILNIPTE